MKVICVMVMSLDGKTTDDHDPHIHAWTSKEDQMHFAKLIADNNLILMGRKTYEAAKSMMRHLPGKLRIVLTSSPEAYADSTISNRLEFTSEAPDILIDRLEKQGYTQALLVGGAKTNTKFMEQGLIDEIFLTIEPKILGNGAPLFANPAGSKKLKLQGVEKLNNQGTVLLKYFVGNNVLRT